MIHDHPTPFLFFLFQTLVVRSITSYMMEIPLLNCEETEAFLKTELTISLKAPLHNKSHFELDDTNQMSMMIPKS